MFSALEEFDSAILCGRLVKKISSSVVPSKKKLSRSLAPEFCLHKIGFLLFVVRCSWRKMKVGDKFSSYEEFKQAFEAYKASVCNQYWVRDGRTLESHRRLHPEYVKNTNPALIYRFIKMACIKGGRPYISISERRNKKTPSRKQDCPASISLGLSKCKQFLTVTELNEDHNHSSSRAYFDSLMKKKSGGNKPKTEVSKEITKEKKLEIMEAHCKAMAALCSEVSMPEFYARIDLIRRITKNWTEQNEISSSLQSDRDIATVTVINADEQMCQSREETDPLNEEDSPISLIRVKQSPREITSQQSIEDVDRKQEENSVTSGNSDCDIKCGKELLVDIDTSESYLEEDYLEQEFLVEKECIKREYFGEKNEENLPPSEDLLKPVVARKRGRPKKKV